MNRIFLILIALLIAVGTIPMASAAASLTVGGINYDSNVVKDESITVTSTVSAASVSGTLTVDVTLTDNSGMFNIPAETRQVQFTADGTKSVSWTITATSTGTSASPFTVSASGDDGGSTAKTSSSVITVKDRPVLSVSSSTDVTTVSSGDSVAINYVVTNSASVGSADATNVQATLTLPSGWSLASGTSPLSLGTLPAGTSSSGSWVVVASSPSYSNSLVLTVTSTVPGGSVTSTSSITGPAVTSSGSSGSSGGGGGGGGATGETFENVASKESKKVFVIMGEKSEYNFINEDNPIKTLSFVGKLNSGNIDTLVEVLHNVSALVNAPPEGHIYKNMNIWVGKGGWAKPATISDPQISFAVNRSWIESNGYDTSDVRLMRFTTNWDELDTEQTGEDDLNFYFTSSTPGFSPFSITVKGSDEAIVDSSTNGDDAGGDEALIGSEDVSTEEKDDSTSLPGFGVIAAIIGIAFAVSARSLNKE